ncbi:MAG: hypothetical protein R3E39_28935 [Anaerolineae bacterium]
MQHNKRIYIFLFVALIALLAVGPILAKGDGKPDSPGKPDTQANSSETHTQGNGNGSGNGNGNVNPDQPASNGGGDQTSNQDSPTTSTTDSSTTVVTSSDSLLGCQKNNPNRLDCSSLEVTAVCDGDVAVFTITNTGAPGDGDMRAPTQYRLIVDGVVVETGSVQLAGGTSMQITYSGGGTVKLEADQQIGHPGNSLPQSTVTCSVPTATETPVPTDEPTPTDEPYSLAADTLCPSDGSTLFIISNNGGDMTEPVYYVVTDMNGAVVDDGWVQLMAGESFSLQEWATGMLTLDVAGGMVVVNNQCVMVTDEPTPTDEPFVLAADTLCPGDGSTLFIISNNGGDMTEPVYYVVTDMNGAVVDDGWVQLMTGEVLLATRVGHRHAHT